MMTYSSQADVPLAAHVVQMPCSGSWECSSAAIHVSSDGSHLDVSHPDAAALQDTCPCYYPANAHSNKRW